MSILDNKGNFWLSQLVHGRLYLWQNKAITASSTFCRAGIFLWVFGKLMEMCIFSWWKNFAQSAQTLKKNTETKNSQNHYETTGFLSSFSSQGSFETFCAAAKDFHRWKLHYYLWPTTFIATQLKLGELHHSWST